MSEVLFGSATTVTKIEGNSRKFYQVIVVDDFELRRWGRVGATGQFKELHHERKREAENSAEEILQAKEHKGYGGRTSLTFAIEADKLAAMTNSGIIHYVSNYEASLAAGNQEAKEAGETVSALMTKLMAAIEDGANDRSTLGNSYALLSQELDEVRGITRRCESLLRTLEAMLASEVA